MLRDAMPTHAELNGKHGDEVKRARAVATERLIGRYEAAETSGRLADLALSERQFCEELKDRNGRAFPRKIGGRPSDPHQELLIWDKVDRAVAAGVGTVAAMHVVAAEVCRTYEHVKKTYYKVGRQSGLTALQRKFRGG